MTFSLLENDRRKFLKQIGAAAALAATSRSAFAQQPTIRLGGLAPLTGSNGLDGPPTVKVMNALVAEINAAGGVNGRKLEIFIEDDQSNPEASVRAVRKLIDVQKVIAICATGASSVAMAVAPFCWDNKVILTTVAGADAVTALPHQGYIFRTQANVTFQAQKVGDFIAEERGAKRVAFMSAPTPFADTITKVLTNRFKPNGIELMTLVYDDKKPSFRSEIDEVLRFKPDTITFAGYVTDTQVLLKDLYRAGFTGTRTAFGFAFNQQLVNGAPKEAVEGVFSIAPSASVDTVAYKRVLQFTDMQTPPPYAAQVYDHINLIALALASTKDEPSGTVIRDNMRKVSQAPQGVKVDNFADGLKLLNEGKALDYDGAGGPCDFDEFGNISKARFRYEQVRDGKMTLIKFA